MKSTLEPTSWRSLFKVHPAAEMFPEMEGDEFKSLVEDIRQHGLKTPIHTWFDKDEQEWLLDGRNRLNALEELGYRFKIVKTSGYGSARPHLRITKPDSKETEGVAQHFARGRLATEPYSYVTSANIHRRHLTTAQKSELIAKLLKADPTKSDRAIAEVVKASHVTVAAKREKLEATGQIDQSEKRTGADGKTRKQPTKKAPVLETATTPDEIKVAHGLLEEKFFATLQPGCCTYHDTGGDLDMSCGPCNMGGSRKPSVTSDDVTDTPARANTPARDPVLDSLKAHIAQWWQKSGEAGRLAFGQWFDELRRDKRPLMIEMAPTAAVILEETERLDAAE